MRSGQTSWARAGVPIQRCLEWSLPPSLVRLLGLEGSNSGFSCNEEVQALLDEAKDASDARVVRRVLGRMLTIMDDPPAIYYAQPKWTTVLQANIEGFFFNPINIGTYDFWKLSRKA